MGRHETAGVSTTDLHMRDLLHGGGDALQGAPAVYLQRGVHVLGGQVQAQLELCQVPAGSPGALGLVAVCSCAGGGLCHGVISRAKTSTGVIGAHFSMLSSAGFATHASLIHRFELKLSSAKAVTSTIMVAAYSAL